LPRRTLLGISAIQHNHAVSKPVSESLFQYLSLFLSFETVMSMEGDGYVFRAIHNKSYATTALCRKNLYKRASCFSTGSQSHFSQIAPSKFLNSHERANLPVVSSLRVYGLNCG
jgi:hypothetical protein